MRILFNDHLGIWCPDLWHCVSDLLKRFQCIVHSPISCLGSWSQWYFLPGPSREIGSRPNSTKSTRIDSKRNVVERTPDYFFKFVYTIRHDGQRPDYDICLGLQSYRIVASEIKSEFTSGYPPPFPRGLVESPWFEGDRTPWRESCEPEI